MVSIIGGFALVAMFGCLAGRLLGPVLKVCPYRLGAQLGAALPALVGVAMFFTQDEIHGPLLALDGVLCGMGAAIGVFLTGHRTKLLACTGALLGGAAGAALMIPFMT